MQGDFCIVLKQRKNLAHTCYVLLVRGQVGTFQGETTEQRAFLIIKEVANKLGGSSCQVLDFDILTGVSDLQWCSYARMYMLALTTIYL